jgi:hypothetical protein
MGQNDFAARKSWASRVVVGFWWYSVAPCGSWRTRPRRRWWRADQTRTARQRDSMVAEIL